VQSGTDGCARVSKSAGKFEWPNAVLVYDGIQIDVSHISASAKLIGHLGESSIEKRFAVPVGQQSPHFAGEFAQVTIKKLLVFPVDHYGIEEVSSVEV
jgi:hypothetical protein